MQKNFTTYFTIAALSLGCFFVLVSCENDLQEVDNQFSKKIAVEEAFKVESYLSQGSLVKAKLTAPYMLRLQPDSRSQSDSPYYEFPRTLHVDFYDDSTRIESKLDANYGKYREYENKVLLRDNVIVINIKNGDTLRTSELWWDQNKQEFYTDKPAEINKRDGTIARPQTGIRAKQDLSWYEFYTASGQLPVPKDSFP